MLRTYKAIIRNNYVEWDNDIHEIINSDNPVSVYITILDEPKPDNNVERGKCMVSPLNKLVKMKAFGDVDDPVEFIREMRQERELPGRQDAD